MLESQLRELEATVDALIRSTISDEIVWSEINKTTFAWTNPRTVNRLVLQRTGAKTAFGSDGISIQGIYQLQAFDAGSRQAAFTVSTEETDELRLKMAELFEIVQSRVAQKGISFLKSILPGN